MSSLNALNVKVFADGADLKSMLALNADPLVKGLTTNPTLMAKAGIADFEVFAREVLLSVAEKPISLEVFSDDLLEMRRQALKISKWGENVYVKIPVTNTRKESTSELIRELSQSGVKLNVTAILTLEQVKLVASALNPEVPSVVSVFAGRVADTGRDPIPLMVESKAVLKHLLQCELLWASVREVLNIFQADQAGCDIVTVPHDILAKAAKMVGMDLVELSLDTVKMFYRDAVGAGYKL